MKRWLLALALALLAPLPAAAQVTAARLIEGARLQLENLNSDSALVLLEAALQPGRGATPALQTRAFVLYGIARLQKDDLAAAQAAFRQALERDGSLTVDTLGHLSDVLEREFAATRRALQPAAATVALLSVTPELASDTTVAATNGAVRISGRPSRAARVVMQVAPADNRSVILWADTQSVRDVATRAWSLRGPSGIVASGRYALRLFASDSAGQASPVIERILVVSRTPADTQPLVPDLDASAFAPETLHLRRGSPGSLAAGLAIAVGAALAPTAMGNSTLSSGATNTAGYAVAGAVGIATVAGFLRGKRVRHLPTVVLANQQLRLRHSAEQQQVARQNAALREAAPIRVRVEAQ